MKQITALASILLLCAALHAAETGEEPKGEKKSEGSPLSLYKPIYMLFGNANDQVKAQLSFKYDFFYGIIDNLGLYGGYTQLMDWKFYEKSSPVRDINFNPEVFWQLNSKKNVFGNADLGLLDYLQLGFYEHKSNGKDGEKSRSFERCYAQVQLSYGDTFNFGLNYKYFVMYRKSIDDTNRDIQQYIGSWETMVFFKHLDGDGNIDWFEAYVKFGAGGGPNGFNFRKGWQEYGVISPALLSRVRAYVQIFHGYGEFLLDYNVKRANTWKGTFLRDTGTSIRVGVILE